MRFLHAADLHLDSPLRGLDRYDGAPVDEARGATRRAFDHLIAAALDHQVDFVVIAGDLYDGDWPDHNTGLFFIKGVSRLAEEGIAVVLVRGNHDAASRLTKVLRLPKNVRLLADARPETLVLDDLGVALHGQSFATAAVTADLAASYPVPIPGCFNLGLLHTSLDGRPGHDPYAPTTLDVLRGKSYDYWALGHVHAAEVVCREPWVVYPGNTQGRHIRETGPKGCALVTVEDGEITHQTIALDVMRWETLTLDIGDLPDQEALLEAAVLGLRQRLTEAGDRVLAVRVRLQGDGPLHRLLTARSDTMEQELRSAAFQASNGRAWLEKIEFRTRPPLDLDRIAERDDPVGLLVRELREIVADPALLRAVAEEALSDLLRKLPVDLRAAARLDETEGLIELLGEVESDLLARLAGEEGGE
ncbi:MAG: DNA repair exonuclease [Candidatus Contendobacter sp.]|nr:DNA repair exonuclease [Candidatus Contendobacter sp.]MDS4057758.1 DNA repair exonuclease [Candidatus Contendobacter sp.]